MATFKMTMLFNHVSGISSPNQPLHRTGGWSESWYKDGNSVSDIVAAFTGTGVAAQAGVALGPARAALLPFGASITGIRVQSVVPAAPAQSIGILLPGQAGNLADVPQMAVLLACPGLGVNNIRRVALRGIPDAQVIEGEASYTGPYLGQLQTFIALLNSWKFRGRDLSQPLNKIVSITALGVITFEGNVTYSPLDFVRILKAKDSTGNLRGGRFQITVVGPNSNQVTIGGWPFGATTGGSARKDAVVYPLVDSANTKANRVVVKKVGRPFVAYRGRRSRKR